MARDDNPSRFARGMANVNHLLKDVASSRRNLRLDTMGLVADTADQLINCGRCPLNETDLAARCISTKQKDLVVPGLTKWPASQGPAATFFLWGS
ncbi:hypothetical protein OPV22_019434 [Ensete ventricosum]|uniref:Uncharacterized protein n=1 Tax=Ensete ventricosum TaxID=4639 RepID=A0AAV8QBY9_ENSVE|nr:hypothetical protein OPV22_019434 [Ensete ventricosum]